SRPDAALRAPARVTRRGESRGANDRREYPQSSCVVFCRRDVTRARRMTALKSADIESYLAKPGAKQPIALIYGPYAGLVRERVEGIIAKAVDDPRDPFSLARLDEAALAEEPARLVEEAHTVPLFGGRRAVWVKAGARSVNAVEMLIAAPPAKDCTVVIE